MIEYLIRISPGKAHIDSQSENQDYQHNNKHIENLEPIKDKLNNESKVYDSEQENSSEDDAQNKF